MTEKVIKKFNINGLVVPIDESKLTELESKVLPYSEAIREIYISNRIDLDGCFLAFRNKSESQQVSLFQTIDSKKYGSIQLL